MKRTGFYQNLALALLPLALCLAMLIRLWQGRAGLPNVIGGLIPWNDAAGYYHGGRMLVEFGHVDLWNARRPLMAALLGTLFKLDHQNLGATLVALVVFNALGIWLVTSETLKRYGWVAAGWMMLILLAYYQNYAGTTLTENLGLFLGSLGLACSLRAIRIRSLSALFVGFAALTLALCARAGAFFTLPLVLIAAAAFFGDKKRSYVAFGAGIAAIFIGFLLNRIIASAISPREAAGFSNFSFTLYGLFSGGKGWAYVFQDHPELSAMKDPELSRTVYRLSFHLLIHHPLGVIIGTLRSWKHMFWGTGLTDFIPFRLLIWAFKALTFGSVIWAFLKRRKPDGLIVLSIFAGLFLSVPFILLDGSSRVLAATMPMIALMPAGLLGFGLRETKSESTREFQWIAPGVAAVLVLLTALPLWVKASAPHWKLTAPACGPGETSAMVRNVSGSHVYLFDSAKPEFFIPALAWKTYLRRLPELDEYRGFFEGLPHPGTFGMFYDLASERDLTTIIPGEPIWMASPFLSLCGKLETDPKSKMELFRVSSVKPLNSLQN